MAEKKDTRIILGRISSVFGIKGWVKLVSHSQPRENIFSYPIWLVKKDGKWLELSIEQGRPQGKTLVAKLKGVDTREQAETWVGATIAITRSMMPEPADNGYYWTDLIGLSVITKEGETLGSIKSLMETGSNDVMVVKSASDGAEHLVPWIDEQVVQKVELDKGRIVVDWDINY